MEVVGMREKSLAWLNDNYRRARKLFCDGDGEFAMFFYHQCDPVIKFLWETGIFDYEDYCEIRDQHRKFLDDIRF
jgi:hypothetical protein